MLVCTVFIAIFLVNCCTVSSLKPFIRVINLSDRLTPYSTAWELQKSLVDYHIDLQETRRDGGGENDEQCVGSVLCLQHPHVYTLGSATDPQTSGPFSTVDRDGQPLDYETVVTDRGGQATYHGPGQLVFYPILDLNYFEKDINSYLRSLENVVLALLDKYQISGTTLPGLTGVWVVDAKTNLEYKLAAIGVKLRRWVTMHGVSVNIAPDMRYFRNIIPCGIVDRGVGSMAQFIPQTLTSNASPVLSVEGVANELISVFETTWQVRCIVDPQLDLLNQFS